MLSFQGRIVLAKSILNCIPIYNMVIYQWPQSLIKEGDSILSNFIWIGDPTKRKRITLRWEKLCKPFNEGGLGIRSLREVNNVMLYKLNWIFTQREETWAQLSHAKFHTTSGQRIHYHKRSSVWPGIKHADGITKPFIGWIIGKGMKINFWRDSWGSDIPLREHIDLPHHLWKKCTARVSDFLNADGWNFPADIFLAFLSMGIDINNIPYNPSVEDIQIWKPDVHSDFSVKNTLECTDGWKTTLKKCGMHSSYLNDLWITMVFVICRWLWHSKNKIRFDERKQSIREIQNKFLGDISNNAKLSSNSMYNTTFELQVVKVLSVKCKMRNALSIRSCGWTLPNIGEVKLRCDGSTMGNLGLSRIGVVYRDWEDRVLGTLSKVVGSTTNYLAEV
ncbi:hypothetical protein GIB67_022418 [Kingdonia uniflora]|uniref:Uncharacterized protein n=1 Tax=Kingdonia uniflora TaxID=39325 RepID=A0A7J7MUH7_9MAGN|nr:hypothetical protein GIB67_022418 [Kingdonia uniflora]